jgi:uncharacterized delta-60 repeat protein
MAGSLMGGFWGLYSLGSFFPPMITVFPSNAVVLLHSNAVFTLAATGTEPLAYRWLVNGTNFSDGPNISGSQTATLVVSNADSCSYYNEGYGGYYGANFAVVVTNALGAVTSSVVTFTVLNPKLVVEQPAGSALEGVAPISFGVGVSNPVTRTFTLHNTGQAPLNITGIYVVSAGGGGIEASGFTLPALPGYNWFNFTPTIPVGATTNFTVTYTPTNAGIASAVLQIYSDGATQPLVYGGARSCDNLTSLSLAAIPTGATTLAGSLDPTFGDYGGRANYYWFGSPGISSALIAACALQTDGRIVLVGANGSEFAVLRFLNDGSPDWSFGNAGWVQNSYPDLPYGEHLGVAVQPDGKIVTVGYSSTDFDVVIPYLTVVRYNSDGSLDASFGTNAFFPGRIVLPHLASFGDQGSGVVIQPDGKIVIADNGADASAAVRLNANGTLDTNFNGSGTSTVSLGAYFSSEAVGVHGVTLQANGKIILCGTAGNTNTDFALVRFLSNGVLDATFGSNGIVNTDFGGQEDGRAVVMQPDGKIILAGTTSTGINSNNFAIARYNTNGVLDATFGAGGKVTVDFGTNETGTSVALRPDGKILVAGYWNDHTNGFVALARLNSDGSPDTTFNGNGRVTTDSGGYCYVAGILLQPDGNILLTGHGSDNSVGWFLSRYFGDSTITPLRITTSGTNFGLAGNLFHFTLTGPTGSNAVISASTNMQNWVPVLTNPLVGGSLNFTDTASTNFVRRFYRANLQ